MRVFAKVESFKKNKINQQSKFTITKNGMKKGIVIEMFFMILHNERFMYSGSFKYEGNVPSPLPVKIIYLENLMLETIYCTMKMDA